MSRTLQVFGRARRDIDKTLAWLYGRSPKGAETWYLALRVAMTKILESPDTYAVVTESNPRWTCRIQHAFFKTPMGRRYRIVFEQVGEQIRILRIRTPNQRPLRPRDLPKK